jgi:hypothetical protein
MESASICGIERSTWSPVKKTNHWTYSSVRKRITYSGAEKTEPRRQSREDRAEKIEGGL